MASRDDKEKIVQRLQAARHKATVLRARLMLLGEREEAEKIQKRASALDDRIEDLIMDMMMSWKGNAKVEIDELGKANKRVQATIRGVMDRQKRANEVVKAIGLFDEVISIAGKFL